MSTKCGLHDVKHRKDYIVCAEAAWSVYLLLQKLTGDKHVHYNEENHEVSKGKTKMECGEFICSTTEVGKCCRR